MPEVTSHAPGSPSWLDLSTSDDAGALRFYGEFFGWKDDPQDMGNASFYHMQKLGDRYASAIYKMGEDEKNAGVPPHWNTYFTVESAQATADKAKAAGGTVMMEPMDVFTSGTMACIQDPEGGIFLAWQPKDHIGAGVTNEPGAFAWAELLTTDVNGVQAFYTATLGSKIEPMGEGGMDYFVFKIGDVPVAGLMAKPAEMAQAPTAWSLYFNVADTDAAVEKAKSLGGNVLVPPMDIPDIGRFSTLQDPQGAVFSVIAWNMPQS